MDAFISLCFWKIRKPDISKIDLSQILKSKIIYFLLPVLPPSHSAATSGNLDFCRNIIKFWPYIVYWRDFWQPHFGQVSLEICKYLRTGCKNHHIVWMIGFLGSFLTITLEICKYLRTGSKNHHIVWMIGFVRSSLKLERTEDLSDFSWPCHIYNEREINRLLPCSSNWLEPVETFLADHSDYESPHSDLGWSNSDWDWSNFDNDSYIFDTGKVVSIVLGFSEPGNISSDI